MYKKVFAEMMRHSPAELSQLDDLPLKEWVEQVSDDPGIKMLFFYLGCATSVGNRLRPIPQANDLHYSGDSGGRPQVERNRRRDKGGMNSILKPC